jgi:HEAT repeat protein
MQWSVNGAETGLIVKSRIVKSRINEAIQRLTAGDFQSQWETAKQFSDLGDAAVAPLIAIVQNPAADWELRWFAVRILGEFSQPEVIAALTELIRQEEDEELCALASQMLAGMGADTVEVLSQLLDHREHRPLAVQALAQIRQAAVITPLLTVVSDQDATVRYLAVEALGSFHDGRVTEVLLKALQDPVSRIRQEAIKALGRRPDLRDSCDLVERLTPFLWDIDLRVCRSAALSLGRLGDESAVLPLQRLLRSETTPDSLKVEAVRALSWLQSRQGLNVLRDSFSQLSGLVQQEILQVLGQMIVPALKAEAAEMLLGILQSPTLPQHPATIRQRLAMSLGNLQWTEAFEALVRLLADPHPSVRLHGLAALKQVGGQGHAHQAQPVAR